MTIEDMSPNPLSTMGVALTCGECNSDLIQDDSVLRCGQCDSERGIIRNDFLDFMLEDDLPEDFKSFYEEEGTEADKQGGPRINAQKFKIPNIMTVLPDGLSVSNYLDVGCGGGWIMESLRPRINPNESYGIDISATRLTEAKSRNPEATFLRTPAKSIPIESNSIDLATCLDVIEHVQDPGKLLQEVHRVAKRLIIKFPIEDTLFDRFQKEYWWPAKRKIQSWLSGNKPEEHFEAHLHRFNFDSARNLLRQQGFVIENEHVILNPWSEGKSFMYPPAYNIDDSSAITRKLDFYLKRTVLKSTRLTAYVILNPWYYRLFNSGIYFSVSRS